jgi:hypothetical protein
MYKAVHLHLTIEKLLESQNNCSSNLAYPVSHDITSIDVVNVGVGLRKFVLNLVLQRNNSCPSTD